MGETGAPLTLTELTPEAGLHASVRWQRGLVIERHRAPMSGAGFESAVSDSWRNLRCDRYHSARQVLRPPWQYREVETVLAHGRLSAVPYRDLLRRASDEPRTRSRDVQGPPKPAANCARAAHTPPAVTRLHHGHWVGRRIMAPSVRIGAAGTPLAFTPFACAPAAIAGRRPKGTNPCRGPPRRLGAGSGTALMASR